MTYRGLARLLLLLPLVGCREPTQITVQLFSDLPCDALQSSGIALSASSPDRAEASPPLVVARDCSTGANNNSIGTLVLVPSGDPDALVGIRAVAGVSKQAEACEAPGYEGCIVARREVRFQENRALVVKIDLLASCEGNPCDPKTTCVAGEECRGSKVPEGACEGAGCGEEALPPASGGAGGAAGQGGKGGGGAGGLSGSSGQGGAGGSAGQGGTSGDGGGGIAGSSGQGGAGEAGQGGAGEAGAAGVGGGEAGAGGEPGGQGGAGQGGEGGGGSAGAAGEGGAGQGGIAGQSGSAGEGGAGGCVPKTCEQLNANCGTVDDGCGKPISCQQKECTSQACTDGCIGGLSCGANFAGVCGCKPGTTSCAGDDLHQCSVEGNLLKQIKQCEENKCTPAGCSAFSGSWCEGQVYHNGFGGEETCNNSSQVCAAYLGCVQCLPSTYFCKGSDLYLCNDFAALPPMVLVNSCGSVAACQKGASLGFCPG